MQTMMKVSTNMNVADRNTAKRHLTLFCCSWKSKSFEAPCGYILDETKNVSSLIPQKTHLLPLFFNFGSPSHQRLISSLSLNGRPAPSE